MLQSSSLILINFLPGLFLLFFLLSPLLPLSFFLFAHTHARAHTTFPATMGLCASTPAGGSAASSTTTSKYKAAPRSEFDTRVAKALKRYQATAAELPKAQRVKSFNQVILRAGKIHKGFDVIKRVFRRFDADGSDSIDHGELTRALNVLSNQEVTREEAQRVFHEADLYENNMLSLKEFIVCLLLAHVLGHFALGGSGSGSGAEGKNEEQGGQQEDVYGGNAEEGDHHMAGYDFDILGSFLEAAGFCKIKRIKAFGLFRDSSDLWWDWGKGAAVREEEVGEEEGGVQISLNVVARKC